MKRLQIVMTPESWQLVEATCNEGNLGFNVGNLSYSDVINEMILTSKVDIKALQLKHTDLRRSLRAFADKDDLDLDALIKQLAELKSKSGKKKNPSNIEEV